MNFVIQEQEGVQAPSPTSLTQQSTAHECFDVVFLAFLGRPAWQVFGDVLPV